MVDFIMLGMAKFHGNKLGVAQKPYNDRQIFLKDG